MTDPAANSATTQYNLRGLRTQVTYAGGREQDFSYDEDGRNTVIEDTVPTQVQKFMVQFDGNGNRTVTNDANGALSTFTYDPIDRLTADNTSGTGAHSYAYSYDSRGNILTNNESGTTIPA